MARRRVRSGGALGRLTRALRGRGRALAWAGALSLVALVAGLVLWRPWAEVRAFLDERGVERVEALAPLIEAASREAGVDPHLVGAIVFLESRGRVDAVSSADALGLMQLVRASASDSAARLGLPEPSRDELLSNAELNLRLGASHLAWLLAHRGEWSLEQVLVAYNAGRGRLQGWIQTAGSYRRWRARELRAIERGDPHTGALAYARRAIQMRDVLEQRGVIRNPLGIETR
jgi:soluble lytic murein transglycosylase-like protein